MQFVELNAWYKLKQFKLFLSFFLYFLFFIFLVEEKEWEGGRRRCQEIFKFVNQTPTKIHVLLQIDWKVVFQMGIAQGYLWHAGNVSCSFLPMYPNQFALVHTPKSQSFLAPMSKVKGRQPHQPSTCRCEPLMKY